MTILGKAWFTGGALTLPFTIGVILYITDDHKERATIGTVTGADEELDTKLIIEGGCKMDIDAARFVIEKQGNYIKPHP